MVGILTAEDPDNVNKPTQTLKFSLADPDEKMFAVNQTQLMVKILEMLLCKYMFIKILVFYPLKHCIDH